MPAWPQRTHTTFPPLFAVAHAGSSSIASTVRGVKKLMELTATTVVVTGSLALAGLGLASGTAEARVGPLPEYHWCPGENFDPGWGPNWEPNACHDDHHRDNDGGDRSRDFGGPPPPPWQGPPDRFIGPPPPPPFCIPFVNCPPS